MAGTFSPDLPADPLFLTADFVWAYAKAMNGGMQNLQNIGANLLLQYLSGDYEAMIVNDIGPMKIKYPREDKPYNNAIPLVFATCYFFGMVPFFLYFSHSIVTEKESGIRDKIQALGTSQLIHFVSWQLTMTLVNFIITLSIIVPLKITVMTEWSIVIMFLVIFLSGQAIIALIWFVQSLYNQARLSAIYAGFAYGISYLVSDLIGQATPYIPKSRVLFGMLSPIAAVRHTQRKYISFMANDFAITFENWTFMSDNFSTTDGLTFLVIDILLFNALGFLIDYTVYAPERSKKLFAVPLNLLKCRCKGKDEVTILDKEALDTSSKTPKKRNNYLEVKDLQISHPKKKDMSLKERLASWMQIFKRDRNSNAIQAQASV